MLHTLQLQLRGHAIGLQPFHRVWLWVWCSCRWEGCAGFGQAEAQGAQLCKHFPGFLTPPGIAVPANSSAGVYVCMQSDATAHQNCSTKWYLTGVFAFKFKYCLCPLVVSVTCTLPKHNSKGFPSITTEYRQSSHPVHVTCLPVDMRKPTDACIASSISILHFWQ